MKKYLYFIAGLSFALGVNLYLRSFTINFPQLRTKARLIVQENIQNNATAAVKKSYPDFAASTQESLSGFFAKRYNNENKKAVEKKFQDEYLKLKSRYQDRSGQTYLLELDCWNWARYTENVLRLGHPGDKQANGLEQDSLMLAPSGANLAWNHFLFRSSAFLYRAFCFFKPLPLFAFLFYLPLLHSAIFIIFLYLVCFRFWGNLAAIIACLYAGLAPDFLMHSYAGWFDMDTLSLIFPLLTVWAYVESNRPKALKYRTAWLLLSSFWIGLFSFTWTGWWFIFLIIIAYEVYSLANITCAYLQYGVKDPASFKRHSFSLFFFIFSSFLWAFALCRYDIVRNSFSLLEQVLKLNKPLAGAVWPNVYSTVSELIGIGLEDISQINGSVLLFFSALIFLLLLFLRSVREEKAEVVKQAFIIIMVFWFIAIFFACFNGKRFSMFLHLPLGVALGWGVSSVYSYLENKKNKLIALAFAATMLFLGWQVVGNSYRRAATVFPLIDNNWYEFLAQIKDKTPTDAVLNSWWDYGDWFKTVARRRVIFDGQSQNTPQAYWMAFCLLSRNEEEALRILAMLNNGGNRAYDVINEGVNDPLSSVLLLKKILNLGPEAARTELLSRLPGPKAEEVMRLLFDRPPKAYFIVDYTMCNKLGSISYIGKWDFVKAYLARESGEGRIDKAKKYLLSIKAADNQTIERFLKQEALTSPDARAGIVSRKDGVRSRLVSGREAGGIVLFEKGFVFKPKERLIYLYSANQEAYSVPKSLFIFDAGKLEEVSNPDGDLDLAVLVFKDKDSYKAVLLDNGLAGCLFTRLYFLGGAGLKHFKPFLESKSPEGYIRVFEIIWD